MGGARATISSENRSAFLKGYCLELFQNGSNDPDPYSNTEVTQSCSEVQSEALNLICAAVLGCNPSSVWFGKGFVTQDQTLYS